MKISFIQILTEQKCISIHLRFAQICFNVNYYITTILFFKFKINKTTFALSINVLQKIEFISFVHVKTFRNALVQYLLDNCSDIPSLSVGAYLAILGENNKTAIDILKLILLLAMFYIYKCKIIDTVLNI